MRKLLTLALLAPVLLAGSGDIHSHLLVPVGRQFQLGGGQPAGFVVAGRNAGPALVEVFGQSAASVAALVRNLGTREAVLELTICQGRQNQNLTLEQGPAPQ